MSTRMSNSSQATGRAFNFCVRRQEELLERGVEHRRIQRADHADGSVERFERLFLDDRGEALANAGARVLAE